MKIAVIAANGKAGTKIVDEALARGFDVTAFGRGDNKTAAANYVRKDLFDLTAEDLKGFDAVVDAFGAWTPETLCEHSTSLKHLCDVLSGADTRLLVGVAPAVFTLTSPTPRRCSRARISRRFSSPWPPPKRSLLTR